MTSSASESSTESSSTSDEDPEGSESESSTGDSETTETSETTDEPCSEAGCPCALSEDCDPGLTCEDGECVASLCGDGVVSGVEECDDGGPVEGDGCDPDCTHTRILGITSGLAHNCALIEGGRVRCWGWNRNGQLGLGDDENIGDDELPHDAPDVELPAPALQVATGEAEHTCALLDDMTVYCWGINDNGELGYGNTVRLDAPTDMPLELGGAATQITVGATYTCARLESGGVRCWGLGEFGRLGYGNTNTIGDDESPASAGDVPVGGGLVAVAAGAAHACGLTMVGRARCWGRGSDGRLGYGNTDHIGDDENAGAGGDVLAVPMGLPVFTKMTELSAATQHTCALFETGAVHCWGANGLGQLGQGNTAALGDDELPLTAPPISLPGSAVAITSSSAHSCALLDDGDVYCWGANNFGELGYGNTEIIGDDEAPIAAGPVALGAPVDLIDAGFFHTCAVTRDNEIRCWGNNDAGQLGLGNTTRVGDDELPLAVDPISLL